MILQTNNQLTLQEFLNLPPGEGDITYELVDGQAIPKMSLKIDHVETLQCNVSTKGFVAIIN